MEKRIEIQQLNTVRMLCVLVFCSLFILSYAYAGNSSSQTAFARASVKTSLGIVKNSDLNFGDAFPGDPQLAVPPESPQAAVFTVSGEPNRAYNILLPNSLQMLTGNGSGSDRQIIVNRFTSTPARSGKLDGSGHESLKVGATRGNIKNTQESGAYSGVFTVTVAYQ